MLVGPSFWPPPSECLFAVPATALLFLAAFRPRQPKLLLALDNSSDLPLLENSKNIENHKEDDFEDEINNFEGHQEENDISVDQILYRLQRISPNQNEIERPGSFISELVPERLFFYLRMLRIEKISSLPESFLAGEVAEGATDVGAPFPSVFHIVLTLVISLVLGKIFFKMASRRPNFGDSNSIRHAANVNLTRNSAPSNSSALPCLRLEHRVLEPSSEGGVFPDNANQPEDMGGAAFEEPSTNGSLSNDGSSMTCGSDYDSGYGSDRIRRRLTEAATNAFSWLPKTDTHALYQSLTTSRYWRNWPVEEFWRVVTKQSSDATQAVLRRVSFASTRASSNTSSSENVLDENASVGGLSLAESLWLRSVGCSWHVNEKPTIPTN